MKHDFYTYDNIRASVGNDTALLFLTDFGINKYGRIGFINLCDEGDEIHIGEPFGDCEAAKGVFDLISPVEGEIVRVNDDILNAVEYIKYTKTREAQFSPPRERII